MFNLITLDGFFDGAKSWELEWHQPVVDEEFLRFAAEQLRTADMLLFGRITYEGMAAYWQTAQGEVAELMNSLPKVVFSRMLGHVDWANTRLVKGEVAAEIQELKGKCEGNIFVFGSADLSVSLIEQGLFDEYRLAIAPVILGSGKPLFGRSLSRQKLKLLDTRCLSSGCVVLRYEPSRD